ncbi:bub2 protein [Gaertneriomyces semiglobifer]|nr:bub2 protein [Gaertneriomyces semiglobifer]
MLKNQYEALLATKNTSDAQLRESLRKLRRMVLTEGLPHSARDCSLRGRIWKVLLGIYRVSSSEYFTLIERGPSPVHDKIRNDTFRTLATDKTFCARVREDMLTRVLSSFVWKMHNRPTSRLLNLTFSYVQGMNVLAAPFLYVMPELDAFYTFNTFIQYSCPLYVQPALEGVHCGLKLLDRCLQVLDPGLFRFLKAKNLSANIWAFPSVMTLCACTPPLENVLQLWDFLLSYGIHLNILCIISQLMLMRPQLISSAQPMKLLRRLPELNAREIIKHALTLVQRLPEDLYDMLVRHPFDAGVYEVVMGEDGVGELGWDGRWGWEDDRSEMSEE